MFTAIVILTGFFVCHKFHIHQLIKPGIVPIQLMLVYDPFVNHLSFPLPISFPQSSAPSLATFSFYLHLLTLNIYKTFSALVLFP